MKLGFLDRLLKNTHLSNLIKIRPVGADLFYAEGRTDRDRYDEANNRFLRNFANAPKNVLHYESLPRILST